MLLSLEIQNFRCFKNYTVPFRANTVIVGQNNAGKSTLVEALRLIWLAQSRYRTLNYVGPPDWLDGVAAGSAGFKPSVERFDLQPEGLFNQYADPPARIAARFRNGTGLDVWIGPGLDLFAVARRSKNRPVYSRSEANQTYIPDMAVLPPLSLPLDRERVLNEQTTKQALGSYLASSHFRNEILRYKDDYYSDFKRLAERTWPGLQIRDFHEGGNADEPTLSLTVRDGSFVAELAWMGSGLKMWLQIMWFLASVQSRKIIVLDEPDIYMHPDLQRKLVHLTGSLKGQTILTTHSVELLSEVDPEDVLVIDKHRTRAQFASGVSAVQEALDRMGSGQSVQLMRLWTARRFLVVEGKDVPLLSKFQAVLFPDTSPPFGTIPSLPVGGWGGWQRALGAASALKNSAGESIAVYCIFDRDYQTNQVVAERQKEANARGINLHVWKRKELENYFLIPEAILRVINDGISADQELATLQEIQSRMDSFADEMKDATFDAIAEYFQLADKGAGAAAANRRARARVDEAWANPSGKLTLVSGKGLLSRMSQWSQGSRGVSISLGAIARSIQPGEVDNEVVDVVRAIVGGKPFN